MDRRSFTKLLALLPFTSATLKAEDGDYKLEEPKEPLKHIKFGVNEEIKKSNRDEKDNTITIGSIVAYDVATQEVRLYKGYPQIPLGKYMGKGEVSLGQHGGDIIRFNKANDTVTVLEME